MNKFSVTINWMSKAGNPMTTTMDVFSENEESATKRIENKVKKYKRFAKLHGGSAQLIK